MNMACAAPCDTIPKPALNELVWLDSIGAPVEPSIGHLILLPTSGMSLASSKI